MEDICLNNNVNMFFHNVEPRFETFKATIVERAEKNHITFDEDVFMDTIIKCMKTFSTPDATDKDVDNYFWIAFKQNIFSKFSRNKFHNTVNFDDFGDVTINEEYNADIDEIVDLIKNEVIRKFSKDIYDAWVLHICHGYTYSELNECGYEGLNLHNEFRQIKRYILRKFVHKNKNLRMLLDENGFLR